MNNENQIPSNFPFSKRYFNTPPFAKGGLGGICLLLLSACSTLPRTVEVPVAVPCTAPPEVARPRLALGALRPDSPPADVIRAYAESLEAVAGYAEQLETILNGYREGGRAR